MSQGSIQTDAVSVSVLQPPAVSSADLRQSLLDEIHTEHTSPSTYYVGVSYISKVIAQTYIMGAGHFICQRTYMPFTLTPCSIWLPFLWHAFCIPSIKKKPFLFIRLPLLASSPKIANIFSLLAFALEFLFLFLL